MEDLFSKIQQLNDSPKEVFLSYRSTQVDFAYRLFNELYDNNQITTWFDKDVLHEDIGELYPGLIHDAIRDAKIFLFLYSKDSEESKFIIKDEVGYAAKLGKKILCYPIEEADFTNMKPELANIIQSLEWINKESDGAHCLGIREEMEGEYLRHEKLFLTGIRKMSTSIFTDKNIYLIRVQIQKALGYSTTIGNYGLISNSGDNGSVYEKNELILKILPKSFKIAIPKEKSDILEEYRFFTPVQKENDVKASEKLKMKDEVDNLIASVVSDSQEIENVLKRFIKNGYVEDKKNAKKLFAWLKEHVPQYAQNISSENDVNEDNLISIVADITADWFIHEKRDLEKGHFNGAMTGVYEVMEDPVPNVERHQTIIHLFYTDYFTFRCMERMFHILCSIDDKFGNIGRTEIKEFCPFFCSLGMGGFVIANRPHSQQLVWVKRGKSIAASNLWHFSYDETSNIFKDSIRDENGRIKVFDGNIVYLDEKKYLLRGIREEIGIKEDALKEQFGIFELGLIKCDRLEMELLSYAIYDCPEEPSLAIQFNGLKNSATDAHNEISKMDFVPLVSCTYRYTGRFLTPESHHLSLYLNDFYSTFDRNKLSNQISDDIEVGSNVKIGKGCLIEKLCHLGDNCIIGEQCRIHKNVYIDNNTYVGSNVKIQNNNSIYEGVMLEDGVFIGTNVSFINDRYPRAIKRDGCQVVSGDWKMEKTKVCYGASIGAGAVIMCGVTIGKFAMVAAGSVVLEDVPEFAMVAGNPARIVKSNIKY